MNTLDKILEDILKAGIRCGAPAYQEAIMECVRIVRKHMREVYDGWIPVDEFLPDNDDEVFVVVRGRYVDTRYRDTVMTAKYLKNFRWIIQGKENWYDPVVVAWMPIPNPHSWNNH